LKPKYFVGVAVGIVLIYMSLYGTAGFGFNWTGGSGLPVHEDFNNLGGWALFHPESPVPTINPAGELQCVSGGVAGVGVTEDRCGVYANIAGTSVSYTVTWKVKVDSWGGAPIPSSGPSICVDGWQMWVGPAILQNRHSPSCPTPFVFTWTNSIPAPALGIYYTYTFCVNVPAQTIAIYRDQTLISASAGFGDPYGVGQIHLYANQGAAIHVDYVYVDAGLNPPGTSTQYTLTVSQPTGGSISPGTQSYNAGSSAVETAQANNGYTFSYWLLDNANSGNTNPKTIVMNAPHTLSAVFTSNGGGLQLTIASSDTNLGTTSPAPGNYPEATGAQVSVQAIPIAGIGTFDHWMLDSNNVGSANPYLVTMGSTSRTIVAVFTGGGGSGGWDPLGGLRNFLNNASVRELELAVGGILTVACSIVAIVPFKKRISIPVVHP
jgi:hypothetical protein